MAAAFKYTSYAFNVEWNEIKLIIRAGGECSDVISAESMGKEYAHAVHSNGGIISMGDVCKSVECFNINGYNYYKIRDIAALLGLDVSYDSTTGKIKCK